jgi:hypothetical protein
MKKRVCLAVILGLPPLVLVAAALIIAFGQDRELRLPDGSTLRIRQVVYATTFKYDHYRGTPMHRMLEKLVPVRGQLRWGIRSSRGVGFTCGPNGATNLFLLTSQRGSPINGAITLERIQVSDQPLFCSAWGGGRQVAHGYLCRPALPVRRVRR